MFLEISPPGVPSRMKDHYCLPFEISGMFSGQNIFLVNPPTPDHTSAPVQAGW